MSDTPGCPHEIACPHCMSRSMERLAIEADRKVIAGLLDAALRLADGTDCWEAVRALRDALSEGRLPETGKEGS